MKQRLAVYLCVLTLVSALPVLAQLTPASFSADMLIHSKQNDMQGKFYFTPEHTRLDMQTPGGNVSNITDLPGKKVFIVMHDRKMYMEADLNRPSPFMRGPKPPDVKPYDPSNPCANQEGRTCKKVGTETVNGRTCDKWEFSKDGQLESTQWVDQKLHIPVKNVRVDGTSYELQNIKEGSQAASLFEVPSGYQKFDMGGMMGGMGRPQ